MKKHQVKTLDLQDSVRTLVKSWAKKFPCKNIHWITTEILERMASVEPAAWSWTVDAEQGVTSLRPTMLDHLFATWKGVSGQPFMKDIENPVRFEMDGKGHVLAPVYGPQFGRDFGYFLFEDWTGTAKPMKDIRAGIKEHSQHLEFCWQYAQAKTQSFMDDLTSLYNQRYLPTVFEREITRMARLQKQFSVLFMDIDYFKKVNDTRGHWIGSRLLVEVAKVIRASIRTCDYAFRYGGDEFLIVLVDTSPENGQKVAERIRSSIERHLFNVEGQEVKLTMSIGLAAYPDHAKSTVELIQLADQAMYYGKNKSRNIVFLAG